MGAVMTIRPAMLSDVPHLVAMGRAQLAEIYGDVLPENPAQLETLGVHLLTAPNCTVLVAGKDGALVGMMGLVAHVHHLSGVPTVGEVMWWMDPTARGAGLALLRHAEAWARDHGARAIQMAAPVGSRAGLLYERRGYRAVETTYYRPLAAEGG